jgi:hypothetical protein
MSTQLLDMVTPPSINVVTIASTTNGVASTTMVVVLATL